VTGLFNSGPDFPQEAKGVEWKPEPPRTAAGVGMAVLPPLQ